MVMTATRPRYSIEMMLGESEIDIVYVVYVFFLSKLENSEVLCQSFRKKMMFRYTQVKQII
jgi:hypothetical protein